MLGLCALVCAETDRRNRARDISNHARDFAANRDDRETALRAAPRARGADDAPDSARADHEPLRGDRPSALPAEAGDRGGHRRGSGGFHIPSGEADLDGARLPRGSSCAGSLRGSLRPPRARSVEPPTPGLTLAQASLPRRFAPFGASGLRSRMTSCWSPPALRRRWSAGWRVTIAGPKACSGCPRTSLPLPAPRRCEIPLPRTYPIPREAGCARVRSSMWWSRDLSLAPQACLLDSGATAVRMGSYVAELIGLDLAGAPQTRVAVGGALVTRVFG